MNKKINKIKQARVGEEKTLSLNWFWPENVLPIHGLKKQATQHPEAHSCMEQFKNCLVGSQRANFSNLEPFSLLQCVQPKPREFSSGREN